MGTRAPGSQRRMPVRWIVLPLNAAAAQHGKPSQAAVLPNLVIAECILAVAPCTEHHWCGGVRINDGMRPGGWNHYLVARSGLHRETPSRRVARALLHIDDGL